MAEVYRLTSGRCMTCGWSGRVRLRVIGRTRGREDFGEVACPACGANREEQTRG